MPNYSELLRDQKRTISNMDDNQLSGELIEVLSELTPLQMQWLGKMLSDTSEQAIRRSVVQAHEDSLMGATVNEKENEIRRTSFLKFARVGELFANMGSSINAKNAANFFKKR